MASHWQRGRVIWLLAVTTALAAGPAGVLPVPTFAASRGPSNVLTPRASPTAFTSGGRRSGVYPGIAPSVRSAGLLPTTRQASEIGIGSGGWSGVSQTSDSTNGWGDDNWSFDFPGVTNISVNVTDCCIVGDNYEVYINSTLIGVTPQESFGGATPSSGTFSHLVGPGYHSISIRDPGGIYYYNQGNTFMIPAAYTVSIVVAPANLADGVIFVHGIGESAAGVAPTGGEFGPIFAELKSIFNRRYMETFAYVDDRAGGSQCARPPCDSQSLLLDNALALAKRVHALYSATGHGVTLIGYSMGAAIIRRMLAGCPLSGDVECARAHTWVSNVIFIAGVEQGSWVLALYQDMGQATAYGNILAMIVIGAGGEFASETHLNLSDPAESDLAPVSDAMLLTAATAPPRGIHYFNFYGDINAHVTFGFHGYGVPASFAIGDGVVLPGTDNPLESPYYGGSRLCLDCAVHSGYESGKPDHQTSYTEWALPATVSVSTDELLPCFAGPVLATVCLQSLHAMASKFDVPQLHTNLSGSPALSGIAVVDTTGNTKKTSIAVEIFRQIEVEEGVLP